MIKCSRVLAVAFSVTAIFFIVGQSHAIDVPPASFLPGSTMPGRVSQEFTPQPVPTTAPNAVAMQKNAAAPEEKNELGPEAERIKFELKKIILEGNRIYSEAQLSTVYKDKLNTVISIAELQKIVQAISNYYRNNGYILARAILPPQHVANGTVHVRIFEGAIENVRVIGHPRGARYLVQAYGQHIKDAEPVQVSVMEKYLRLANEIPGVQVKAVLEPAKHLAGASDLDLATDTKNFSAYMSYDNYGTRYQGPDQLSMGAIANSIFRAGDTTALSYVTTKEPQELKFVDLNHDTPIGTNGARIQFGANDVKTHPEFVLQPLFMSGDSTSFYGNVKVPLLRSTTQNFTILGGWNYLDSGVNIFDTTLYNDHIRNINVGFSYDFSDRFYGANLLLLNLEKGLNIWGASNDPNSLTISRAFATGVYVKWTAQANRLQQIAGPVSLFVNVKGQYAYSPLLSSVQFAFGGSQLGRGYDPAEIIGDRGAAGSIELRYDMVPNWSWILQSVQLYAFYDAGAIWNIKNIPGVGIRQDGTSTGLGTRFVLNRYVSGNLMITQPLTRQPATQVILGNGSKPRGYFSVVVSL